MKNATECDLELVAFYPLYKGKHVMQGTVHVYHKKFDLDLRGILYIKKEKEAYVFFPSKVTYDEEEKKEVRYPLISFTSKNTQQKLQDEIRLLMDNHLLTWKPDKDLPRSKKEAIARFKIGGSTANWVKEAQKAGEKKTT